MSDGITNFQRTSVEGCVLKVAETETSEAVDIPVARFDVTFALGQIPSASIIPALGKQLDANFVSYLSAITNGAPATLVLTVDGTDRVLLDGFIESISLDDNSSLFKETLSASIRLMHKAVKLAGAPSVSFLYSGSFKSAKISLLNSNKFNRPLFGEPEGTSKGSLVAFDNVFSNIRNELGSNALYFPSHVIKYILEQLLKKFNPLLTEEELDELIIPYDPANVREFVPTPADYLESVVGKFAENWINNNSWEAAANTARYLFMDIVPFNTGFYIANPSSLDREPAITITSEEYINLRQDDRANLFEPIDGIIIRKPTGVSINDEDFTSFPPFNQRTDKDNYYHFREMPDWAYPISQLVWASVRKRKIGKNKDKKSPASSRRQDLIDRVKEAGYESLDDYYQNIGTRICKAAYAEAKIAQAGASLLFPYREDLMPGTNIKLEVSEEDVEDTNFIGTTLYGMIQSTTITGSQLEDKGSLNTSINVLALRNEKDNNDDTLTFDGHGIYEGPWAGMDLFGNLIRDIEVEGPKPPKLNTGNTSNTSNVSEQVAKESSRQAASAGLGAAGITVPGL